jgi:hypothetical protein
MSEERIRRCLENNVSILVGSVDTRGEPSSCRALALTSDDDLATLTVFVPVRTSRDTIANVATTRRLAVVATHPIDHFSIQLKGIAGTARLARENEAAVVRKGFDGFAEILNGLGIPPRVTSAVALWPAFAIEMQVEEIFDQTPGPKAGQRLK